MVIDGQSGAVWRRSRRCDTAACVEVARFGGGLRVRDSGEPAGSVLVFSAGAWRAFLAETRKAS